MDETPQNNSPSYVISHSKCGWVLQQHDQIPEEGAIIWWCPGCNQLLKTIEVENEAITGDVLETAVLMQQQQEQTENTPNTEIIPQLEKPRKKQRKQKRQTKEQLSHIG